MNRRGFGISDTGEVVLFIILNIVFFTVMFSFVARSGENALLYEQMYAKEIALFLDSAKPGMTISLDMTDLADIAKKKGKPLDKIVQINSEGKEVIVSLGEYGGYAVSYFSAYQVVVKKQIDNDKNIILGVE